MFVSMRSRVLLALAFVGAAGAAEAQDACVVQAIRLCDGCTITRRMTVQSGAGCKIEHVSESSIINLQTTVPPKHGVFGTSNLSLQAYVAKQGYTGPDFFEYVITFERFGKPARTVIRNQVAITAERPLF